MGLFIQRGFHDASTSAIARQAGVASGTLFYHFGDKEALINEIYLTILKDLSSALQDGLETAATIEQKIKCMWTNEVRWGLNHASEIRFVQLFANASFVARHTRRDAHAQLDFALDLFAEALDAGLITGMPKEYARDFYVTNALMNINFFQRYPKTLSDDRLENAYRMFWAGLTAGLTASLPHRP